MTDMPESDPGGVDETAVDPVVIRRSAMDLLARREHACLELSRKLYRRYPRLAVDAAVERLREEGLQSDARFSESYVSHRAARGYGPVRIREELRERGIAEHVVDDALQASDLDWLAIARQAYRKKFTQLARLDTPERARRSRFLAYRGFSAELVHTLIRDRESDP